MSADTSKFTIIQRAATFALALLLNGLFFWHFFGPAEMMSGKRALFVALITMVLQFVLALQTRSRFTKTSLLLMGLLVLQVGVLVFSLVVVGSLTDYGIWKMQGFLMFAAMPTFFLFWNYWQRPHMIEHLLRTFLFVSLMSLLLPIINPTLFDPGFVRYNLRQLGFDVIGLARTMGVGVLVAVILSSRLNGLRRLGILIVALPLLFMMVIIGERGPLVAVFLSVFYFVSRPTGKRSVKQNFARVALMIVIAIGGVFAAPVLVPRFSPGTLRTDGRWVIFAAAFGQLADNPLLGTGLGAFVSPLSLMKGDRAYFHNILGEILTETGVLGFCLLLVLMLLPFLLFPIRAARLTSEMRFCFHASMALFVFAFMNANVSGDLTTNYLIWVSYALIHCCGHASLGIDSPQNPPIPQVLAGDTGPVAPKIP